ncbi:ribonuclease J [Paenibacillus agricola]|uniref:Ribonuclease J n=1 Tax=Paenibacillus agricola TaxID=2716264 RepID=A0ABX0JEB5_9BACL|nr:ribonuclease J [Paenibacillus agricola]NHN33222.1 ribonuclease J [Paenibacillus agricola]
MMSTKNVSIFALGGVGEIGKNMYGVQYDEEIIIIDAGLKFPDGDMLGIDLVIPDITYLKEHQHQVKGIFLTHGHEDHIGGLPYILKELKVPVYGAALTMGLVQYKLEEHGLLHAVDLHVVNSDSQIDFNHMSVSFFRTNHSIPDSMAIVIQTPVGVVVQTGDFKFDFTPADQPADLNKMADIGRRGVLALLSDSTNSEKEGFTPSEKTVGDAINDVFFRSQGRILFATFASNVHRLQQVVEAAELCGRKIVVIGRSMEKIFQIGQDLGYIRVPEGMMIPARDCHKFTSDKVAIICTGSQGEPGAALTRIANGSHRSVVIEPGDTVIFSSSPIPGNTININRSIDSLYRAGADVIHGSILDIHTSGHGCQEDLKLMLNLMKPQYFIPIHGEYRMLVQHAKLASQVGINPDHIFVLDIGQVLHISGTGATLGANLPAGNRVVRGQVASKMERELMSERRQLSESGFLLLVATVDTSSHRLLSGPYIVSRGFVYVRHSGDLIKEAEDLALRVLKELSTNKERTFEQWEKRLLAELTSFFYERTERSTMILPMILTL